MQHLNDNELAALAQRGNSEAEGTLVRRYLDVIRIIASKARIVGVEKEDLWQEGSLAVVRAARKFDPEAGWKFGTLARRCIGNALIDLARRRNLAGFASLDEPAVEDDDPSLLRDTLPDPRNLELETLDRLDAVPALARRLEAFWSTLPTSVRAAAAALWSEEERSFTRLAFALIQAAEQREAGEDAVAVATRVGVSLGVAEALVRASGRSTPLRRIAA
jgi:RNA polymerase sigma factor (sigma-70 family)